MRSSGVITSLRPTRGAPITLPIRRDRTGGTREDGYIRGTGGLTCPRWIAGARRDTGYRRSPRTLPRPRGPMMRENRSDVWSLSSLNLAVLRLCGTTHHAGPVRARRARVSHTSRQRSRGRPGRMALDGVPAHHRAPRSPERGPRSRRLTETASWPTVRRMRRGEMGSAMQGQRTEATDRDEGAPSPLGHVYVLLFLTVLMWGGGAVAGKLALRGIPNLAVGLLRFGLAAITLWVVFRREFPRWSALTRSDRWLILGLGAFGGFLNHVLFFAGLSFAPASHAAVIGPDYQPGLDAFPGVVVRRGAVTRRTGGRKRTVSGGRPPCGSTG